MRTERAAIVVGASAVILTAGVIAAPDVADQDVSGGTTTEPEASTSTDGSTTDPSADSTTEDATADSGSSGGVTGTFDGPVVSNIRGDYQVSLTFEDGVLVDVTFPVAGTSAPESTRINDNALPLLEEEFLEAQSWDVEYVSGASFTSPAMVESAQAAFEEAGL
ncbi:MAG: FMN-binding protein [Demequina sp.]|uniref:FMN-binding protein n=1 Tax=Demequina sp. TaxID=2050685 RepID=UPI003A867FEE